MFYHGLFRTVGSVLLNDEANSLSGGTDIAINMDDMERDRYQQQLHLIEENVSTNVVK